MTILSKAIINAVKHFYILYMRYGINQDFIAKFVFFIKMQANEKNKIVNASFY